MKRTHIVVHHSLTEDGMTVSWPAIRRFHVEVNGWKDIGYHYGVEVVGYASGTRSIEALVGRPETAQAAACPQGGMNALAFHVCAVGNFDDAPPSEELLRVLADRVVRPLMEEYGIPVENVVGHRDFNPAKTCPGKRFDLERLRRILR